MRTVAVHFLESPVMGTAASVDEDGEVRVPARPCPRPLPHPRLPVSPAGRSRGMGLWDERWGKSRRRQRHHTTL